MAPESDDDPADGESDCQQAEVVRRLGQVRAGAGVVAPEGSQRAAEDDVLH